MDVTVLLTSCGGYPVPGMVDSLRTSKDPRFRIVGVDMSQDAVGRHVVDSFHRVPGGLDPQYPEAMLEIAQKEEVDVIVPLSDEELLGLAPHKKRFSGAGIEVACSDQKAVEIATDKGRMLRHLDEKGVPVPRFAVPRTLDELDSAVEELGYPGQDIVVKPTRARGARGFRILTEKKSGIDLALGDRCFQHIPYPMLRGFLEGLDEIPSLVAMEFLAGTDYNVDVLASGGRMLYCLPMVRVVPDFGPVQVGRVVHDPKVDDVVGPIIEAFGFDHNINVELAYREKEDEGNPYVFEINPRVSAPIVGHKAAGVDLLKFGILHALAEEIPLKLNYRETVMRRSWREFYDHQ